MTTLSPRIYIIGAGAIGRSLAAVLQNQRKEVTLVKVRPHPHGPHKEVISLTLPDASEMTADVTVAGIDDIADYTGIILLTTKSYVNSAIAGLLKNKTGNSPLVILQNGLGVENVFLENSFPAVYRCVLFATAQEAGNNTVRFRPVTSSPIGICKGQPQELEQIITQLNNPVFPFREEQDLEKVIWKKTITNCVFNSICPLLETDNGIFHRNPDALTLATELIEECLSIARQKNISLTLPEIIDGLLLISRQADGQLISTYQDIQNGRPTEIETLNLEIARQAAALGQETVVSRTRLLGEMIRLKSSITRADK
ncbi:MAG: 2-dehydropantoate 2-reductase [Chitinophagaceae bacterium]|nr:2-dehydropantoate 2-reductase [Chitinophagaceae bacterium]